MVEWWLTKKKFGKEKENLKYLKKKEMLKVKKKKETEIFHDKNWEDASLYTLNNDKTDRQIDRDRKRGECVCVCVRKRMCVLEINVLLQPFVFAKWFLRYCYYLTPTKTHTHTHTHTRNHTHTQTHSAWKHYFSFRLNSPHFFFHLIANLFIIF